MRLPWQTEWTPARIEELRAFWDEGLATNEIGWRMGISKNAVIGKVHRLGLEGRPSPIKGSLPPREKLPGATRLRNKGPTNTLGVMAPVRRAPPMPHGMPALRGTCQFPLWTGRAPRPALFCGKPVVTGSWCPECRKVVFSGGRQLPESLQERLASKVAA